MSKNSTYVLSMKFSQSQIRELGNISVETFRYWKQKIPALEERSGRKAQFTVNDLLAISIIAEVEEMFGAKMSLMSEAFNKLFEIIEGQPWFILERCMIMISQEKTYITSMDNITINEDTEIIVPLKKHIDKLKQKLLVDQGDRKQQELPLPPSRVRGRG